MCDKVLKPRQSFRVTLYILGVEWNTITSRHVTECYTVCQTWQAASTRLQILILYVRRDSVKELSDVSLSQKGCSLWCELHRALCCVLLARQGNGVMLKSRAVLGEISRDRHNQQDTRGCDVLTDATVITVQKRL